MDLYTPDLHISKTSSAKVSQLEEGSWHLEIPAGDKLRYRLAQLDDHSSGSRSRFPWRPPLTLGLEARVSAQDLPGTWGFGVWNDPFSFLLGYQGLSMRLPALPDAAWFFHASSENYLSFRDDLPANGLLAATFSSTKVPTGILTLGSPILALALIPGAAQWVRKLLRHMIKQDSIQVRAQLTDWHAYRMEWEDEQVSFYLDEAEILRSTIHPHPPLTLVIWIDNQYAALPPKGGLKYGYLTNSQPAWLEIRDVMIQKRT